MHKAFFSNAAFAGFVAACTLGATGSLGLLTTRVFSSRLKGFTTRATVFNLCMLGAIFATGLIALINPSRGLLAALTDAVNWRDAGLYPAANCHFVLVALFLAYFPFTHMTHMYMKYFTWHDVRWDDTPARCDRGIRKQIANNLARRVSWQAPHIHGASEQSWAESSIQKRAAWRIAMIRVEDIARPAGQLTDVVPERMIPLPPPYDGVDALPPRKSLSEKVRANSDCSLDGFLAVGMSAAKDGGRRTGTRLALSCRTGPLALA